MPGLRCYTNCYGPFGVWTAVEQIRATGIDKLELALRGHNLGGLVISDDVVITEQTSEHQVARFHDHLKAHGVSVTSCNIGGGDLRTEAGLRLTETRLRRARQWFGVDLVVSNAGQPADAAERRQVIDNLRCLGETARQLDMTIALETHKGPTQNAAAMRPLMIDLQHDHIGINFDTGNIAYYNNGGDAADELRRVAPLVRNVHLKDNRGRFEDWFFPALGEGGAVDFAEIRRILEAAGYQGAYTIELEGIGGEPELGLPERQARITRSVAHLRECGY